MKKSTRRRPELESLEAVVLMSTVSAEVHPTSKAAAPVVTDQLEGTFTLQTHKVPAMKGIPAETILTGSGDLDGRYRTKVVLSPGSLQGFEVWITNQSIGIYSAPISLPARGASISVPYAAFDNNDGAEINGNNLNPTGTVTISDIAGKTGKDNYVLKLS